MSTHPGVYDDTRGPRKNSGAPTIPPADRDNPTELAMAAAALERIAAEAVSIGTQATLHLRGVTVAHLAGILREQEVLAGRHETYHSCSPSALRLATALLGGPN